MPRDDNDLARDGTLPEDPSAGGQLVDLASAVESRGSAGWEPLIPLRREAPLPTFPTEALPDWMRRFTEDVATATQTPVGVPGTLALGVLAVAFGGRARVQVFPDRVEPLNAFFMVALPPGSGKSPAFRYFTEVIVRAEACAVQEAQGQYARDCERRSLAEGRLAQLRQQAAAATAENSQKLAQRLEEEAERLADTPEPVLPRLLADDVTPEKLVTLLAQQGGRLSVVSSESTFLQVQSGRYSKDRLPNFDVAIKAWDGVEIRVDRSAGRSYFVRRPALTLLLGTQNAVLAKALCGGMVAQGLAARFLYCIPDSRVGYRDICAPRVSPGAQQDFDRRLRHLVDGQFIHDKAGPLADPPVVILDRESVAQWQRFSQSVEHRLRSGGDLGSGGLLGWGAKVAGQVLRLAGLIHLGELGWSDDAFAAPISRDTMARAVLLGEHFILHARRAFLDAGVVDPRVIDMEAVLAWAVGSMLPRFAKRDAFNGMRARFPQVKDLDPVIGRLVEYGYLREIGIQRPPGKAGRSRSPLFEVHPDVLGLPR